MSDAVASRSPRVTIGVPVYNGERFLRATLDSLLIQTFTDFELIIADNASTDGTEAIVREFMTHDSRIVYVRNPRNLGPSANYNIPLDRARGEFFKWAAADDLCGPDFLKLTVEALDLNPGAVIAYPRTRVIDADGNLVADYSADLDLAHPSPHVRLRRLMTVDHKRHGAHEMFGLMRTAKLIEAGKKRCHVRADSVVLARMALLGPFVRVESVQFYNRDHNARSSKYLNRRNVRNGSKLSGYLGVGPLPSAEWWDAKMKGKIVFPDWRVMQEYYRAVADMPLARSSVCSVISRLAYYDVRHTPKLLRDLLIAAEQAIRQIMQHNEPNGHGTPQTASR